MANIPMNGQPSESDPSAALGTVANWAGAAISIALVVGAVMWGHSIISRDVSGVPVVRAIDGPMREQPDDPGGSQAAHQGLSVNQVAAEGSAQAPGDRLVLAPNSVDLRGEDQTLNPNAIDLASRLAGNTPTAPTIETPEPIDLSQFTTNSNGVVLREKPPVAAEGEVYGPQRATSRPGLGKSLRPRLRPDRAGGTALASASSPANAYLDGSSLAPGTRLVQLGAVGSAQIAQAEWVKLQSKFPAYLGDKQLVIQRAESGGRTFYRLRATGFADLSEARRLCAALKAENADCIPVVTR